MISICFIDGPGSNYTIRISTTDKDLVHEKLTSIKSAEVDSDGNAVEDVSFDAIPVIKAALQAQV